MARAPKAAIALAAAPFLHGKFVVRGITLVGVELGLVHLKDGRVRLGSQKDEAGDDIIGRISDVIDARGSESSSLQSFSVRDARLSVYDEVTGLTLTAPRANVTIRAQVFARARRSAPAWTPMCCCRAGKAMSPPI